VIRVVAAAPAMTLYDLRADGEALYWRSSDSQSLIRFDGQPRVLAPALGPFVLDGDHVYVSHYDRLLRVAKAGGVGGEAWIGEAIADLAVDRDHVYIAIADTRYLDGRPVDPHPGRILRLPKAGGPPVELVQHEGSIPRVVVDEHTVYYTTDRAVCSLAGGPLAATENHAASSIALDDTHVIFCAGGEVRRVPKTGGPVEVLYRAQIMLEARVYRGSILATRNLAFDRGTIAERAALIRIQNGRSEIVADLDASPHGLAADDRGVFVLLTALGSGMGQEPDRVVQAVAADGGRWYDRDTKQE